MQVVYGVEIIKFYSRFNVARLSIFVKLAALLVMSVYIYIFLFFRRPEFQLHYILYSSILPSLLCLMILTTCLMPTNPCSCYSTVKYKKSITHLYLIPARYDRETLPTR
jgi:hypothetical protein